MVAEQVRWSPAYPFSAAPSAAQSIVASFEVDAPADLPHGTGAVSPADCRPIGAGWASIRAEGAYRAGLNCRRHTRPAARPPRLDRLSRSAPFPMMWRQHSTAVLPRSCRGSAASCEPSRCAHVFCCRLRRQAPTSKMLDLLRSAYADAGRAWSAPLMQVAYSTSVRWLLGRV